MYQRVSDIHFFFLNVSLECSHNNYSIITSRCCIDFRGDNVTLSLLSAGMSSSPIAWMGLPASLHSQWCK